MINDDERGGVYARMASMAEMCGVNLDELLKRTAWDIHIEGESVLIIKETHSDLTAEEIISVVEEGMVPCGDTAFVLYAEGDMSVFEKVFKSYGYIAYERAHGHGDLVIAPVMEMTRLFKVLKQNVIR